MSATITTALGEATELLSRMAQALHQLLDSVDDSTFAAVMGAGCLTAGKAKPTELAARIKSEQALLPYILSGSDGSNGRKAVRMLLDAYGAETAQAVFKQTTAEYSKLHTTPAAAQAAEAVKAVRDLEIKLTEIKAATQRITADPKHARSEAAETRFERSLKVVRESVGLCQDYKAKMAEYSETTKEEYRKESPNSMRIKELQAARDGLKKEIQYINNQLIEHFDGGLDETHSDTKFTLTALEIPTGLDKGKGLSSYGKTNIADSICKFRYGSRESRRLYHDPFDVDSMAR